MVRHKSEFYVGLLIFAGVVVTTVYLGWLQGSPYFGIVLPILSATTSSLLTIVGLVKLKGLILRPAVAGFGSLSGILPAALSLGMQGATPLSMYGLLLAFFALIAGVVWWIAYVDTVIKMTNFVEPNSLLSEVKLRRSDWEFQFYLALSRDAVWVTVMITIAHVTAMVLLVQTGHSDATVAILFSMIWTCTGIMHGVYARSHNIILYLIREQFQV